MLWFLYTTKKLDKDFAKKMQEMRDENKKLCEDFQIEFDATSSYDFCDEYEEDMEYREYFKRLEERSNAQEVIRSEIITNYLKSCGSDMYKKWLGGVLAKGKKPTHFYDYSVNNWEWFVATRDFKMEPLYGSLSLDIIVPEGVEYLGGELAHSSLYFLKDFTTKSMFGSIYMFDDC